METTHFESEIFASFNIHKHTGDEIEFRVKCKKCKMSVMDIEENSCLRCDCEWFQSVTNETTEEEEDYFENQITTNDNTND